MNSRHVFFLSSLLVLAPITPAARAADWPQLQGNAGHTGYTADQPEPPFSIKWVHSLGEPTHTGSPPIVADGKVFLGTAWGNLLALDRDRGTTIWRYRTEGPITSTPAFENGLVYTTSFDRHCHAVGASDGSRVWTFATDEGIWAGPVVAEDKVFVAGRDAFVYGLEARTGKPIWKSRVGAMVMVTPAYDEGVLYVGAGDNRVSAFEAAGGKLLWQSDPLPGAAIREYWLVAGRGTVIATTQLVHNSHQTFRSLEQTIMRPFREANHGNQLVQDQLIEQIRQWYLESPHLKTFHVLDARTGKEKFVAPIIPVHGGGCVGPLPVIGPEGFANVIYANVRLEASGWAFPGRLDLNTGHLEPLIKDRYWIDKDRWEWQAAPGAQLTRRSTFDVGFCVSDQSWGLSRGGKLLFTVRDPGWPESEGAHCSIDLTTGDDRYLVTRSAELQQALREGQFGGAFHATSSPMVISGKQVFHKMVRNTIVCFEGQ